MYDFSGHVFRSPTLYPAELRAPVQVSLFFSTQAPKAQVDFAAQRDPVLKRRLHGRWKPVARRRRRCPRRGCS